MQLHVQYLVYSVCLHVQKGETPLLNAVNGHEYFRAGRCKVVKCFVQRKKMNITQFSQVM